MQDLFVKKINVFSLYYSSTYIYIECLLHNTCISNGHCPCNATQPHPTHILLPSQMLLLSKKPTKATRTCAIAATRSEIFFIVLAYLHWQHFYKQLLKTTNWPLCVRCSASLVVVLSSEISCVKNRSNHSASAASQPRVSFPKLGAEIRNYCGKNGDGDGDGGGDGDDGDGDGDDYGDDDYEKGTMVAGAALRER